MFFHLLIWKTGVRLRNLTREFLFFLFRFSHFLYFYSNRIELRKLAPDYLGLIIFAEKLMLCNKLGSSSMGQDHDARSPWTGCSQFLPTTQKIIQFSDGKVPKLSDRIVRYIYIFF